MNADEKRATLHLMGWVPRGMYYVRPSGSIFILLTPIYGDWHPRSRIPESWPYEDLIDDRDIPMIYQMAMNYERDHAKP